MGLFSKLFDFARKASSAVTPTARGSLRTPLDRRLGELRSEREQGDRARKEEEKRLDAQRADPAWRFVEMGEVLQTARSSNVASVWYEKAQSLLYVQYKDGSLYEYRDVTPGEAESLFRAPSFGKWVWDNLRTRGDKFGARKEYALVTSGSRSRAWEKTPEAALEHSQKVAEASGAKSPYERLGKMARKRPS